MEKQKFIEIANDSENRSNKDLVEARDFFIAEFDELKMVIIDLTRKLNGRQQIKSGPDCGLWSFESYDDNFSSKYFPEENCFDVLPERIELHRVLQLLVDGLSVRERYIFQSYFWLGMTKTEIGAALNLTAGRIVQTCRKG